MINFQDILQGHVKVTLEISWLINSSMQPLFHGYFSDVSIIWKTLEDEMLIGTQTTKNLPSRLQLFLFSCQFISNISL